MNNKASGTKPEFNFDSGSGGVSERLVFNHRWLVIILSILLTLFLGYHATQQQISASFNRVIPQDHPYIQNYLEYQDQLPGLGNTVRIVVENTQGDIFDAEYLEVLREANDRVYLIPGTDRSWMRSVWQPIVRYAVVTEEGIDGGPVIPGNYDGSPEAVEQVRQNVGLAGLQGSLVANDLRSSMIEVPLLDQHPETGDPLDYHEYSRALEEQVRVLESNGYRVHIIGFAKLSGDLIDGVAEVMTYFVIAAAIALLLLVIYTRCFRSTLLVLGCSLVGVIWQLGLVNLLGYDINPYSVLVPFLVFAIGVSHAAQMMNGVIREVGHGLHRYVAARIAYRRLARTGVTALVTDAFGFAVLMVITIPVIQDLAVAASIGVALLILTNLVLLPVLFSLVGVNERAAARRMRDSEVGRFNVVWLFLDRFTSRRWAAGALVLASAVTAVGYYVSLGIQVGDLDEGAPELRADSRYNKDVSFINRNFGLSTDQFAVIVATDPNGCGLYPNLMAMSELEWQLRQLEEVSLTQSLASTVRRNTGGGFEANPRWFTISRDQRITDYAVSSAILNDAAVTNTACSVTPLVTYLKDHKAGTLDRVLSEVEAFASEHNSESRKFLPAAGSAGIEAVTNIVVSEAHRTMLVMVYGAVILLCWFAFRNFRAVLVAVVPLIITSILCQALMVYLGIGIKVATLPVIALGVGIGVDYALYLLSQQLYYQREGFSLESAYEKALRSTGKIVALIGFTLAASVVTWVLSPIKFQADMGILLTFMFLWNMLGALVMIPALSSFLLRDISPNTHGGSASDNAHSSEYSSDDERKSGKAAELI